MDIIIAKDKSFKIKGKTGSILITSDGPAIESLSGEILKSFSGPGEYEVVGISIIGVNIENVNVFVYEIDNLRICHLGETVKKLPENKLGQLGDIDVLLLPTISESIEIIQQFESDYVIPYGYDSKEDLEKLLKESGLSVLETTKFTLKKEELIEDSTAQIVVLQTK